MNRDDIMSFLRKTLLEMAETEGLAELAEIDESTPLWGKAGMLSSTSLVELMLAVEDFCIENNIDFIWTNDSILSESRSVYSSAGSLSDYIAALPAKEPPGDKL